MILVIDRVLPDDMVAEIARTLARVEFVDGRATAGWNAAQVKRNTQAAPDPGIEMWRDEIAARLRSHALFALAARPKRIIGPMFSRYRAGDHYGAHVDEALLDGSRSDLSFTLFLSEPSRYEGGELILDQSAGEDAYKLSAGSLVLYPATTLHRVEAVTRGQRLAAVGWVRSLVRRAGQRELLFDLETAHRRLFEAHGKTGDTDLIAKCAANLMRMWCDD